MFLLVPAHPGFPGQIPQSRKTVVVGVYCTDRAHFRYMDEYMKKSVIICHIRTKRGVSVLIHTHARTRVFVLSDCCLYLVAFSFVLSVSSS